MRRETRYAAAIAVVAAAVIYVFLTGAWFQEGSTEPAASDTRAYVVSAALNVRSTPSPDPGNVVGVLVRFDVLRLLGQQHEGSTTWYRIEDEAGYVSGWVHGDYIARGAPPSSAIEVVDYGVLETPTLDHGPIPYVGAKVCKSCHEKSTGSYPESAYEIWEGHEHSQARRTLDLGYTQDIARRKRGIESPATDARCVKCHTTAYGAPASRLGPGYDPYDGVSCEACHGPGGQYVQDKQEGRRHGPTLQKLTDLSAREQVCRKCHNSLSPTYKQFNLLAFSRVVRHWAEDDAAKVYQHAVANPRPAPPVLTPVKRRPAPTAKPTSDAAPNPRVPETVRLMKSSDRYAPFEFSHGQHARGEKMKGVTCQTCHHEDSSDPARCNTCHQVGGDAGEKKPKKNAFHSEDRRFPPIGGRGVSCIGCHLETGGKGPTSCDGCHRLISPPIEAQADPEVDTKEGAPSKPKAPETLTLMKHSGEYVPFAFSHGAHARGERLPGVTCQTCHHEDGSKPGRCETCHALGGDAGEKERKKRAFHNAEKTFPAGPGQQVSCLGCHSAVKATHENAPTGCTGCHRKEEGSDPSKDALPSHSSSDAPDTIILNEKGGGRFGKVEFSHAEHAGGAKVKGLTCETCHHLEVIACRECHHVGGKARERNEMKRAFHNKTKVYPKEKQQFEVSCMGCHTAMNAAGTSDAPTRCAQGCHSETLTGR